MSSLNSTGYVLGAARWVRRLSLPIVLFWVGLAVLVNVIAPQLQAVVKQGSGVVD
ncbi:hypothetical protein BB170200_01926 [Mycobacterium marinum]|nr:hypothetical protein BB170200_01926 [Mycobacterium marinum]